ncbi:hypothetical protein RR48_05115 [Papilio machaon]|uniref:OCEL domain-containing protein n=1 Tax=Papilio machaon TaxID=76193 RepID=A0A0N1PF70_PAPMA|nr:hypothetical protein RR48_05115 [Papilio machaon]
MEGPQGSFECVRGGAGARRLECCGPLPRRMRVLANDDSYEATKDRMARTVAAEQSKCTRVIKPNQTDIGRRINKRLSHTTYSNGSAAAQLAERAERAEKERLERLERERAERAERERVERAERERVERAERERVERAERERAERAERERAERLERERVERVERERAERAERERAERPDRAERAERAVPRGAPPPHQRPPPAADVSRRSINERLIQLLALKPFKKPELYARLSSEGIKEKDRAEVNKILPKIGSLKDNCYHLRRHIWNDVNEDWPFYTEEEKRMLKRYLPFLRVFSSVKSSSPSGQPIRSFIISDTTSIRPLDCQLLSAPIKEWDTIVPIKKDNGYTLNFNTVKDLCPSPVKPNGFRNSPTVEQTSITEKDITNTEQLETTDLTSVPDENMTDLVDIERQYPAITSSGTRRAYKQEFSELYTEYRALYARVAQVAALFSQLEQQLRRTEPASPQRRVSTPQLETGARVCGEHHAGVLTLALPARRPLPLVAGTAPPAAPRPRPAHHTRHRANYAPTAHQLRTNCAPTALNCAPTPSARSDTWLVHRLIAYLHMQMLVVAYAAMYLRLSMFVSRGCSI